MTKAIDMSPEAARQHLLDGKRTPVRVKGKLDLRGFERAKLSAVVSCQDLDASGSKLKCLPAGINVNNQLILDNCETLESLPNNLKCGSLSLQNCNYLDHLPENLSTWFLDMTNCSRFSRWPKKSTIHRGIVRLRNCVELQSLPIWFDRLGQLDLSGCIQLTQLPENLKVSGWVDIGGTNIEKLPESLGDVPLKWRGVPISKRIAFAPETIKASEIINEKNSEIRRVMIERMGYLKFAIEAKAKRLDKDSDPGGERQLLKIDLNDDEPLIGLSCFCPSTGRQYFLRVPPNMKSCHQAAAWLAGFDDPKKYRPVMET